MQYPTKQEVESATREQLGFWCRFLESPGWAYLNKDDFYQKLEEERQIMDRICERLKEKGMFTPELSKSLGWEP